MKKLIYVVFLGLIFPQLMKAQPMQQKKPYDITKDRLLYTVGYAHLDTEWNWDYPTTINEYILNTMMENFRLFEKYPDYEFNFTGSRRYTMMKEYYPELFKKVQEYVHQGRWHVSGSSVDEGEVNISSSESLIRQILYGNNFFRKEFNKESVDYMLPDCFGFLCNLPTIFHHSGLLGFSTQKLTWRAAVGVPFNVGVWNGPDGKGVIAALNATDYGGKVEQRLDKDPKWIARLDEDQKKTGYAFDYRYYGVGDQGGAPRENDVKRAEGSLNNNDGNFRVLLSSSDQMYKDITPEIRKKLPVYSGDLLLIEHSSGSMTSQAFMKRMNRKNELLAQSAEAASVMANWTDGTVYPQNKLNNAWDLVLGSQFHDILPGTSIPKAYEYAWNDEFIAANGFAESLKNGVSGVAGKLNTQTSGKAIVVYNPVARTRDDIVTAELEYSTLPDRIAVFDKNGKETPSQVIGKTGTKLTILFRAQVPSMGMAVYDVREVASAQAKSILSVTNNTLENEYYKVRFAVNGDIESILDKKASKEILSKPARLEFQHEKPNAWPAWNMDWNDRQKPAFDFMDKDAELTVVEQGPVRVTLQVKRKGQNSGITQLYSLATGDAGKRLEVTNKIDWQSREVSLKASFPLAVSNENATYNLGVGTISRGNNSEKKFEVPSKEWFDLTDKSGKYGVSILEDCKYGSDKPDNNTLRLTLLYTPGINNNGWSWLTYQSTQDWGIHDVKYAVYGHSGDWNKAESPWQAKFFNQPLMAFESPKHAGDLGRSFSMLAFSTPQAGLMAFKKMEQGDYYLVRINELSGKDLKSVKLTFPTIIADAYEVNGQEKKIGKVDMNNSTLTFDLSHYTIRSFAVKLKPSVYPSEMLAQVPVDLPFNVDVISTDENRDDGNFNNDQSYPSELLPDAIESEGIHFAMTHKSESENNAVACSGQTINLPQGNYTKLYLLAAANEDTKADFSVDGKSTSLLIQQWTGKVGQFYNRILSRDNNSVVEMQKPYSKSSNIAWYASHVHSSYPSKNEAYQYGYLYKYEITIPAGAKTLTLPDNKKIKLLGLTAARNNSDNVTPLQPLYDDFKGNPEFKLRTEK
ncbi:MAG: glycoside hydrolase family 38 C-terminal domain-containing protein [Paludibacter sp.]|nr:glycoside hydrolase family 38 C-terminal domain-containing protein [Paludibacter sp.]